jgi:hypothetical protein
MQAELNELMGIDPPGQTCLLSDQLANVREVAGTDRPQL